MYFEKVRVVKEAEERERLAKEEDARKAERAAAERERARAEGDEPRRSSRRKPGPPPQVIEDILIHLVQLVSWPPCHMKPSSVYR